MKPGYPAPATAASLADRLATIAGFWPNASRHQEHPIQRAELDALRDGLNSIALEAEAGDQGSLAAALRRIALLSEVWECLDCEPDQAEAATEMTDLCLTAIEQLVCEQRTGGGDLGIGNEILRQSNTRWSEYLSSGFALFAEIEHVCVDAQFGYIAGAPARRGESRVVAIDVGFLAHFWHPVWAKQTK